MEGSKILSIVVENLHFLHSFNYLPMSLKSGHKSFDLTCKKEYYLHFFNTASELEYVGSHPERKYYGDDFVWWAILIFDQVWGGNKQSS